MTKQERLLQWMREKGFNMETLAQATGDSYSSIYMMTKGGRSLNDAFKWRFALAFGWEEASRIFDSASPSAEVDPEPSVEPAAEPTPEPA